LSLGDQLLVMSRGTVLQKGAPQDVFTKPQHEDVASAVGMENLLTGRVKERVDVVVLEVGRAELHAVDPMDGYSEYFVCIRGENVTLESGRAGLSSARNRLQGTVVETLPVGSLIKVIVNVGFDLAALVTRQACADMALERGAEVMASFKASAVHLIPKGLLSD